MADVNANIGVGIDTSDALSQLKNLQRQISQFHTSVAKSSETAAFAQRDLQKNFLNSVNAIQGFSAELRTVKTTAESFTTSLEKNKFSIKEYFRYAGGATKTFGKTFRSEFDTIEKTAIERVKTLQTQYIKMGRDANGAMQAIAIRPTTLDMTNLGTQTAITAQKQALFNQLVKQGSTQLLNFGKNTQWAGRQLMVGFTLPLATLGMTAGKTFMEMEAAALKFKKVYGDLFTSPEETKAALDSITELGKAYTQYGIAVADTVALASDAAAAGFQGVDLQRQTAAATRLSVLGQIEGNQALETTIALQNAFKMSSDQLATSIDFLNAVENQTVVSLDDITTAIPKVAPVIMQLGGDVKDLAFFLAAMKEGGINASEGANALKSGLGALINPTAKASQMLAGFGINVRDIVNRNQGDLKTTVVEFAQALDQLAPLDRARAIEQLFGKFQFARLSTLFENVSADGTQAARVLELAGSSIEELSNLSEKELGQTAASSMMKFKKSIEDIKVALVPLGQLFLEIATPFVEFGTGVLEAFNNLPDGVKKAIGTMVAVIGGLGPVLLMTFGLVNNGIANMIKFFATLRLGYLKITGQAAGIAAETQYMTTEQLQAAAAAASLDQAHSSLTQRFTAETGAVQLLKAAYEQAAAAGARFAAINPGMMTPGSAVKKFASGGMVGGSGNKDSVPAMLMPGEFVVKKDVSEKMLPFLEALNSGNIPGFADGGLVGKGFSNATMFLPESINTLMGGATAGAATGDVTAYLKQAADAAAAPLMAVMAKEMGLKLKDPSLLAEWQGLGGTLIQSATDALEKSGKQFINDDDFENIVVPAMQKSADSLTVAGKEVKTALNNAFEQIRTVAPLGAKSGAMGGQGRVNLPGSYRGARQPAQQYALAQNPEMFQQTERFSQSRNRIVKSFQTKNVATGDFEVATMSHLKRSITATVDDLVVKVAPYLGDQSARILKAVSKGAVDGIKKSTNQASPSKDAFDAGANIGKGAINGIKSTIDDAQPAGQAVAQATVAPRRATSGGNLKFDNQSSQYMNEQKFAKQEEARQRAVTRVSNMNMTALQGLSAKVMGASFAMSSITGVMSMFGGKLGEAAGAIMQVTNLLFLLGTTTAALAKTQGASKAMDVITNLMGGRKAGGGPKSPAGGFRGGLKGRAGLANVSKNVGLATKAALPKSLAKGAEFAGKQLLKVGLTGTKLIPIIGWIITAFTIGVEVFKKSQDAVNGLGQAANLSTEKLGKLGDILNVKAKDPGFKDQFTGAIASTNPEQRDINQQIREAEGFKDDFALEINAIKGAAKVDAERVLNSLALQLSGAGFEKEMVEGIVSAIVTEAGRTDLELKFASISSSSKEGLASITKIAAESANALKSSFGKMDIWDNLFGGMGGGQFKAQVQTTAGEFSTLFGTIKNDFEGGKISAEQFNEKLADISTQIEGLDPRIISDLMPAIADNLGITENLKGIKNWKDQLLLVKAATAGIKIPKNATELLKAAGAAGADNKTLANANKLRAQLNGLIRQTAIESENANAAQEKQKTIDADIQAAIDAMTIETQQLENQAAAHKTLVQLGYDEATAYTIASNAMYAAAIAAAQAEDAISGTTNKTAELMGYLNAMLEAQNKIKVAPSGGGSASKSPYREALEQLGKQRKEIKNTIKAYASLRKAGFSAAEAATAAADATIAAGLASKKIGSKEWKALVNQIRLARLEALKTAEGVRNAFDALKSQAEEYFSILERQAERKYSDSIRDQEKAIDGLTDSIEAVNEELDAYQEQVSDIERNIELNFDRPIEALQEQSDDLNRELELMDRAADKITERYDEQAKALARVAKINQQILGQQKQQVTLADALSQGDIAAAASIMQEMAATQAENAAVSTEEMLAAAKEAEIAGLRSSGGQSREEIEQSLLEIGDQIYELEEKREAKLTEIRVIQDQMYAIEKNKLKPLQDQLDKAEKALKATRDQLQAELDAIDAQRQKWEDAQLALDLARVEAGEFRNVIDLTKKLTGDVVNDWKSLADKTIKLTIETVKKEIGNVTPTPAAPVSEAGTGGGGNTQATIPKPPPIVPTEIPKDDKKDLPGADDPFAWLGDLQTAIDDFFGQPWVQSIGAMFAGTAEVFYEDVIKPIEDKLKKLWSDAAGWLDKNLIQPAKKKWDELATWVDTNFAEPIRKKVDEIATFFDTKLIQPVKNKWTELSDAFNTKFIEPIKKWWEGFTSWFTSNKSIENKIDDVKAWWRSIPDAIKDVFETKIPKFFDDLVTKGKNKLEEIKTWFKNLPASISSAFDAIGANIASAVKVAINKVIDAINRVGSITMPDNILGIPLPPDVAGASFRLWNVQRLNSGGEVAGMGPDRDSVPTMLTPGEYVVNRSAAKQFGPLLSAINSGGLSSQGFATKKLNSPVYSLPRRDYSATGSGGVYSNSSQQTSAQYDNSVYNYNLSVNVEGSDSSATDIANVVINRLRNMQSQNVRGQVIR